MFRAAVVGIFGGLAWGLGRGHQLGTRYDWSSLVLLIPSAVLVLAALLHWVTHPEGIRDTVAGGSIDVKRSNPDRLEWSDWALWMTHAGRIDRRANMVRVERRLLMGLIPLDTTIKSTREFNRVHIDEKMHTYTRRRRGFFFDSYTREQSHLAQRLVLSNDAGEQVVLLDLNSAPMGGSGQHFMQELKLLVDDAVAGARA